MSDEEFSDEGLRKSIENVGPLYEVLVAEDGEILDGKHRLAMNPNHPKKTVPAKTKAQKIIVRLNAHHRRRIPREETQALIMELAQELEKEGIPRESISAELTKRLPYSESYLQHILPQEFKKPEKVEAGRVSAALKQQEKVKEEPLTHPIVCSMGCGTVTYFPKDWKGTSVCGACYDRLSRGTLEMAKPKTQPAKVEAEKPPARVETRVYEAPGKWKENMQQPVSRMDQWLYEELMRRGIPCKYQEPVCILWVRPEVTVLKGAKPVDVFLDTEETHLKREATDIENRTMLSKRGRKVLELKYDAYTEEQKKEVLDKVLETIGEPKDG
jgi:hypothetical protein